MRATSVLRDIYRHDQRLKIFFKIYILNLVTVFIKLHIHTLIYY